MFDFRNCTDEQVEISNQRCAPWQAARHCVHDDLGIFILAFDACRKLHPWIPSDQRDVSQMLVPYVEAGYPGPLPLSEVSRLVQAKIRMKPETDPLIKALLAGRTRAALKNTT